MITLMRAFNYNGVQENESKKRRTRFEEKNVLLYAYRTLYFCFLCLFFIFGFAVDGNFSLSHTYFPMESQTLAVFPGLKEANQESETRFLFIFLYYYYYGFVWFPFLLFCFVFFFPFLVTLSKQDDC